MSTYTVKIVNIKDPSIANNGLRLFSMLYKVNHKDIIEQVEKGNKFFLTNRKGIGELNWDIEDIMNIKNFLEGGMELEIIEIKEAA